MPELFLVLVSLAVVGILGTLSTVVSASLLLRLGFVCLGIGLAVGLPAGLWYHVVLYRALAKAGPAPKKWWLSPSDFHAKLTDEEFASIKPWYVLGALSFAVALAGGLTAMVGMLFTDSF